MTEAAAQPLKVAIVGTAPTSRMMAPFADPSWQIWTCSAGNVNALPRVDMWYEMHAVIEMMAPENRAMAEPFYAWLREKSDAGVFHVVMCEVNQFVPKAMPYPLEEMIKLFGRNWFTSSIAYMMAVAIARGATEIGLFGVDMAAGQEHYEAQRAGCTHFIEIAEARGIKVHVPFESSLKASTPLYGYWEGSPFGRRLNAVAQQIQGNLNSFIAQKAQLEKQIDFFQGAMEQINYFRRTWVDGAEVDWNMGNIPELVEKLKTAGAPAQTLDEIMQRDTAPARADVTITSLNTTSAFDALLKPPAPNGAMHEPEPNLESMS